MAEKYLCYAILPYQVVASMYYATTKKSCPYLTLVDLDCYCEILSKKCLDSQKSFLIQDNLSNNIYVPKFFSMPYLRYYKDCMNENKRAEVSNLLQCEWVDVEDSKIPFVNELNKKKLEYEDGEINDQVLGVCDSTSREGSERLKRKRSKAIVFGKKIEKSGKEEQLKRLLKIFLSSSNYKDDVCRVFAWGVNSDGSLLFNSVEFDNLISLAKNASEEFDKTSLAKLNNQNDEIGRFVADREFQQ